MIIMAPISVGELIDKITILRIKTQLLTDQNQLKNVESELRLLEQLKQQCDLDPEVTVLEQALHTVNRELWHIENLKRACEHSQDFGDLFVNAAREVYLKNDHRAAIKKQINVLCGSDIREEKSHCVCDPARE